MWVERIVTLIKPGLMAEAVAHVKSAAPQEGVSMRVLRPITGERAGFKLIVELSFEDLDAHYASWANPQPAGEWMRRWIELSQNRGTEELYEVVHDVPGQGEPDMWVDRRIRWAVIRRRGEMLALWRDLPATSLGGLPSRVLVPRAGDSDGDVLISEATGPSFAALEEAIRSFGRSPEGQAFIPKLFALEQRMSTRELLRVLP